jgi:glutaredoxin-like YruB-family protein
MIQAYSHSDLLNTIKNKEKAYLLLFKQGSEISDCAFKNIAAGAKDIKDLVILYANVNEIRDIHDKYNITTVPSLLEFEMGVFKNLFKGCNDVKYYKALFEDAIYYAETKNQEKSQKKVKIYSTPTCSWCNALKAYLKLHRIRYKDIDVSRDQQAAEELLRRSGQAGVPQTEINGEIIVGFNKARINELLGIRG